MALLTILFTFSSYAEGKYNPASDFKYITDGSEYEAASCVMITEYIGNSSIVNIPEIIENLPVTRICEDAFKGNNFIKIVTIPSSVKIIENRAFQNCKSLKEVYLLLASTASIEGRYSRDPLSDGTVFSSCSALEKVVIEAGVALSIDYNTFHDCSNLTTVTLPRNINASWCFTGCTKLKTINFRGDKKDWPFTDNDDFKLAVKNGLVVNYNYIGE